MLALEGAHIPLPWIKGNVCEGQIAGYVKVGICPHVWSVAVKVNRRLVRVWVDVLISNMEVPTIKVVIVVLRSGCLGITFTLEDSYQEAGGYVQIGEYENKKSVARGWIWEKEKNSGRGRDETPSIAYMSVRGENLQQWRQMLDRGGEARASNDHRRGL